MIEIILFIFHVLYEICRGDFLYSLYSWAKSGKMYLQVSICSLIQDGFRKFINKTV